MKLVSVVSPCYNGERYLKRYFEALLKQTYRPLELVLVNDGSKDHTEEIIEEYRERLISEGITLKYIKKENGGLGAAINDGLKETTGDYLIWPDTDDFLYPQSIQKRVEFLEENPQYGFVVSDGETYLESDLTKPVGRIHAIVPKDGHLFNNVVSGNVVYTPCGYMIRMKAFLSVNPSKSIYPSRYGQDIQMLMPISYSYLCGHISEPLYARIDRADSLSKKVWNENDIAWKNRVLGLSDIYTETLKQIGGSALAYIPYIKFRDLRILSAISKKVSEESRKEQRTTLFMATRLLLKEIIKTAADIIFH